MNLIRKLSLPILALLFQTSMLMAYSDSDLDGIEDPYDSCPNSLITDLVDINGCRIKSLQSDHHFDIIAGVNYTDFTDDLSTSLQLDYYYKQFSAQLSSTYLSTDENTYNGSNVNDPYFSLYYTFTPSNELKVRVGLGAIIAISENNATNAINNTDYISSINVSYTLPTFNLFAGYSYTAIKDKSDTISYQDVNAFNAGVGLYPTTRLYSSLSYNTTQNIYKESKDVDNISFYNFYSFDENWFATLNYEYYLTDKINSFTLKVGYYF
jgi:hypothetical protein